MSLLTKLGWGLLVAVLFVLPYCQFDWWQFFHTTLVWVLLWIARFGRPGLERLGLALSVRELGIVLPAAAAVCFAATMLQDSVAAAAGLVRVWDAFPENVDPLYQALNEEILLGWLLLRGLSRWIRTPWVLCWSVALAFAALHFVFYRWGSAIYEQALSPMVLLSLLLVGVARNTLILWRGHVGWAWALHGAWNLGFFGGYWHRGAPADFLGEPDLFEVFVGHPAVLTTAAVLVLLGTALVWRGAHPSFTRKVLL